MGAHKDRMLQNFWIFIPAIPMCVQNIHRTNLGPPNWQLT